MGEFDKEQGGKPGFDKEQGGKPGFDKEQQQGDDYSKDKGQQQQEGGNEDAGFSKPGYDKGGEQ